MILLVRLRLRWLRMRFECWMELLGLEFGNCWNGFWEWLNAARLLLLMAFQMYDIPDVPDDYIYFFLSLDIYCLKML